MKRHNLHSHTTYSDGLLTPEELITKAKESGIEIIGITDHAFANKLSLYKQVISQVDQTEKFYEYLNALRNISSLDIEVKIGLEIESDGFNLHPSQLPFELLNNLDYVLFEYVNDAFTMGRDISEIIKIRNKLKIPIGLAHTDMQQNYNEQEAEISKKLADNDIFIEICQSEFLRNSRYVDDGRIPFDYYQLFSHKLIEELVKNEVKVVIGTDVHYGRIIGEINDAQQFIVNKNLKCHEMVE